MRVKTKSEALIVHFYFCIVIGEHCVVIESKQPYAWQGEFFMLIEIWTKKVVYFHVVKNLRANYNKSFAYHK